MRLSDKWFGAVARGQKADIYHATYYTQLAPGFTGQRVLTVYDLIDERFHFQQRGPDPTRKAIFDRADGIFCISECTRRDVQEFYGIPSHKLRVTYLANALHAEPGQQRPIARPYILYVGRRAGYKNFQALLDAWGKGKAAKEHDLVCVGGGALTVPEQEMAASMGVADRIHTMAGDDAMLATCYAHARLFVYPSLYEGFGIPPLEAMHYGCPVLSSNTSSLPEVCGDAAIYFDPANVEQLRGLLETVLLDDQRLAALSRAGRERERVFSWDRCARETYDFYCQLTSGNRERARDSESKNLEFST